MNKQQLLALIQSLPDDAYAEPINFTESTVQENDWYPSEGSACIGMYQRKVEHDLVLQLRFKTTEEASFRRTYGDPDGSFRNLRRIG